MVKTDYKTGLLFYRDPIVIKKRVAEWFGLRNADLDRVEIIVEIEI